MEVDFLSVFSAWSSYSNPKAADAFLFDDQEKILRRAIVTLTEVASIRMESRVPDAVCSHFGLDA